MDSDRLNRWLTLGANLGVLAGIALILVELNQNAELTRAQMMQARVDNLINSYEARMHSDYWADIQAKHRAASTDSEWLNSLTPAEYERVVFAHYREGNDIQAQYLLYMQGLLPEEIWSTSTRGQIRRFIRMKAALKRGCTIDGGLRDVFDQIALEDGLPKCIEDGIWEE